MFRVSFLRGVSKLLKVMKMVIFGDINLIVSLQIVSNLFLSNEKLNALPRVLLFIIYIVSK